jgi:hypothetical protein
MKSRGGEFPRGACVDYRDWSRLERPNARNGSLEETFIGAFNLEPENRIIRIAGRYESGHCRRVCASGRTGSCTQPHAVKPDIHGYVCECQESDPQIDTNATPIRQPEITRPTANFREASARVLRRRRE